MGAAEARFNPPPPIPEAPRGLAGCEGCSDKWQCKGRPDPLLVQPARWGGEGGWFAAHLFLCLAGPRALFAQQHVVPQEEIKPALKVQGTAKLCWEVAEPGPGWSKGAGGLLDSLPESQKEGDSRPVMFGIKWSAGFWQELHTRGLSVPSDPV